MKSHLRSASPQTQTAAFSLIEIALSLAIIAFAIVALLGLLPAGVDASKRAGQSTVVANILDSLHHRLQGEPLVPRTGDAVSFSPALFDVHGVYLPPDAPAEDQARAIYRADVKLENWQEQPANTSLRVVTISLSWPVTSRAAELPANVKPQTVVSYPVTTLTGTDWPAIARSYTADPEFVPKIGF